MLHGGQRVVESIDILKHSTGQLIQGFKVWGCPCFPKIEPLIQQDQLRDPINLNS